MNVNMNADFMSTHPILAVALVLVVWAITRSFPLSVRWLRLRVLPSGSCRLLSSAFLPTGLPRCSSVWGSCRVPFPWSWVGKAGSPLGLAWAPVPWGCVEGRGPQSPAAHPPPSRTPSRSSPSRPCRSLRPHPFSRSGTSPGRFLARGHLHPQPSPGWVSFVLFWLWCGSHRPIRSQRHCFYF